MPWICQAGYGDLVNFAQKTTRGLRAQHPRVERGVVPWSSHSLDFTSLNPVLTNPRPGGPRGTRAAHPCPRPQKPSASQASLVLALATSTTAATTTTTLAIAWTRRQVCRHCSHGRRRLQAACAAGLCGLCGTQVAATGPRGHLLTVAH